MLPFALIVSLAGALAGAGHAPDARLRIVQAHPVTVHGSAFHARRRVRVVLTVTGQGKAVRHPRTGSRGSFTVTFARRAIGHCDGVAIVATDSSGRRAVLRRRSACPPT
jgi:hypothetical protein